ncbi:hypothetical protein [Rhodoplanes azumiensis]|uniref:Uncharacterized protein n=1 Tax=Rhodoplanes azumiensis TaxID=1897628 RepID=A0ABW5ANV0_9BRAD
MASESAFRGFDRTFWTRAVGAVMLVCIAVGSTAAMAATPDAALVEGSQRLLIASVLVFAAIGFVGYRMAGGYIESLKHDVEIAQPANDAAAPVKAAAPVEVTVVTSRVTPVVARPTPVRGRVTAESLPQPIKVAPKIPEPQPVQPVRGLFMRAETPSRAARVEPRGSVVSRVEPRSAAPTPVTSPVVGRGEARRAAPTPVVSPVVPRSGRTAPVTPVTSSVQPRQVERVVARSTPSRTEPVREIARDAVREPVRAETARREAPREVARETVRTAVAPTVVTSRVQGVRGRESGVRARA